MRRPLLGVCGFAVLFATTGEIQSASPWSILWTTPILLFASLLIAWAAESARFLMAQGLALALLAWLQTLPEFAVEAVLAWHRQMPLLLSNLTGALRLLTGVGWPLIYVAAALAKRSRGGGPLRRIQLPAQDGIQVVTLGSVLVWIFVLYFKASLGLFDAVILIGLYVAYLAILKRLPPALEEANEEIERVPRAVLAAKPIVRNMAIAVMFGIGGALIYFVAEPFLASMLAVSAAVGISQFVAVQWIAPFVSEFPEKVSAFYWARTVDRAPIALMNMVSSNINQWTLLAAMLPLVLSFATGTPTELRFDSEQKLELLLTASQSLLGVIFLLNLEFHWWQAAGLFTLWVVQFAFSVFPGAIASNAHLATTAAYLLWCVVSVARLLLRRRMPPALASLPVILA